MPLSDYITAENYQAYMEAPYKLHFCAKLLGSIRDCGTLVALFENVTKGIAADHKGEMLGI